MKDIRIKNVTKIYSGAAGERAVDDVSLDVEAGEFFFLLGSSGCGKTTLLRMIAGLTAPTAGRIVLGGRDVTDLPANKRNTAMVFQNYALWPHMTVMRNVEFGPRMRGVAKGPRRAAATRMLEMVQMAGYAKRKPAQLSGGQQQRVALARALAADPDCLLLDEPLSNLDARLRMQMRSELRHLVKSTGATAIYVTHDQTEAMSMADRIAVMDAGKIHQIGTPQDVYNQPATRFVADFLGEGNFVDGRVAVAGPTLAIDTPVGRLLAKAGAGVSVGDAVTCCVRPERAVIRTDQSQVSSEETAVLPAQVEASLFLGDVAQVCCRMKNADLWKVTILGVSTSAIAAEGRHVSVLVPASDVIII